MRNQPSITPSDAFNANGTMLNVAKTWNSIVKAYMYDDDNPIQPMMHYYETHVVGDSVQSYLRPVTVVVTEPLSWLFYAARSAELVQHRSSGTWWVLFTACDGTLGNASITRKDALVYVGEDYKSIIHLAQGRALDGEGVATKFLINANARLEYSVGQMLQKNDYALRQDLSKDIHLLIGSILHAMGTGGTDHPAFNLVTVCDDGDAGYLRQRGEDYYSPDVVIDTELYAIWHKLTSKQITVTNRSIGRTLQLDPYVQKESTNGGT